MMNKKFQKRAFLTLIVSLLVACSHAPKLAQTNDGTELVNRSIASTSDLEARFARVYHSYVQGFVLMEAFDALLDGESAPLQTPTYGKLMAVRGIVDQIEDEIHDFYLSQVNLLALSPSSADRTEAQQNLDRIGRFFEGVVGKDNQVMSDGMKLLVLSNIGAKEERLSLDLKQEENKAMAKGDYKAAKVYRHYRKRIKANRSAFYRLTEHTKVDPAEVRAEALRLKDHVDFRGLSKDIDSLGNEIKMALVQDRNIASTTWAPSAGPSGNVTGFGFPKGTWAMTYDDGPGTKTTQDVLKNLQDLKLKATFFQLAKQVILNTEIAKTIWDAQMDIGCHSWDHPQVSKIDAEARHHQIEGAIEKENSYLAEWHKDVPDDKTRVAKLALYRLPFGAGVSIARVRQEIADQGLIHVLWNVDTLDWQDKNPDSVYERTMKQINHLGRGVILFHDIHPQSVIASKHVLETLKASGAKICTIQGIINQMNNDLKTCD